MVDPAPLTWQIDPARSYVEFAVKHMLVSTVTGRFGAVTGTIARGGATSYVDARVALAGTTTGMAARDDYILSPAMFDAVHYPAAHFRSRRVQSVDEARLVVVGDLTLLDVTTEVTLYVRQAAPLPRSPEERIAFDARTTLSRRGLGLRWNQALETGGFVVGDEVKLRIHVEALRS